MLLRIPLMILALITGLGLSAQNSFSFNCARDTTMPGCASSCYTLKAYLPDIHEQTTSYSLNRTNINACFNPYLQPDDVAGTPTNLSFDDTYSGVVTLNFPFHFYGTTYNQLIVSPNGMISFDISKATSFAHYSISNNLPSTNYDKAIIMGPYHDLDPSINGYPGRRIQYQEFGTAPHRRWVLSFYKVSLWSGSGACNNLYENTHQLVLYESTGIVEVFLFSKDICSIWQSGRAMIGMQDFNRTTGINAPGRSATDPAWGGQNMNEVWRFVPSAGASLFKRAELYDLAGNLLSTGTTVPQSNGTIEASFPNVCSNGNLTRYVVKSVYRKIDDANVEVVGYDTVNVFQANGLAAQTTTQPVNCYGQNSGSVTIVPTSGISPFQYSLDGVNWVSTNTFSNLPAGLDTAYFKDANGCVGMAPYNIIQPGSAFTMQQVQSQNPTCNGVNNGIINVYPTGGTPPYQYSLNGSAPQATNSFTGLAQGAYNITVTDANGCTLQNNVNLTQPQSMTMAVQSVSDATCDGGNDGQISVLASGGTPTYLYSLNGGTPQNSGVFNVAPGSYQLAVRDANNCQYVYNQPVVVGLNNNLTFTPMTDQVICEGSSVNLQMQTNATVFTWSESGSQVISTSPQVTVSPTTSTLYTVTAELGRCSISDDVQIDVNTAPVPDAGAGPTICYGQSTQLNASGGLVYEWTPSTYLTGNLTGADPGVKEPQSTITYSVKIISDQNGCPSLTSDEVTVNVTPPIIVWTNPGDTIGYIGDKIQLAAFSIANKYEWFPATGLSDPNIYNPVISVDEDRTYRIVASTDVGCKGETTFTIKAYQGPEIYVPTGFTPNNDGKNDLLRPFPVGIKTLRFFRVFNRWGEVVYSWNGTDRGPVVFNMLSSDIGWDGTANGQKLTSGTYIWIAEGITKEGKVISRKGNTTLIR